jgi:hypothetical protein
MFTPFLRHWYVTVVPVAVRVNVVVEPEQTVWVVGWSVIDGGVLTVRATRVDVTLGVQVPLTTQSNPLVDMAASAVTVPLIWRLLVCVPL